MLDPRAGGALVRRVLHRDGASCPWGWVFARAVSERAQRDTAGEAYRSGDFDATIWDVPDTPQRLLESEFFGEGSRIGYRNPEIVRWLEMLTVEMNPDAQDTLYARINEMLRRDVPVTFLFPYVEASVAHRRIRGLRTPDRVNLLEFVDELWIENDN